MDETYVKFASVIEAVRFDGMDLRPVAKLLGYKIEGAQILLNNMPHKDVPLMEYELSLHGGVTLKIQPYGMPQMELTTGMWLVKVGPAFFVAHDSEFRKTELVL